MSTDNLKGLSGWLVLVGLGVIISPFRIVYTVLPDYYEIFSDGTWLELTTPATESYSPAWAALIIGEIVANLIFFFTWIYLALLFFTKKSLFPKLYQAVLIFMLAFIVIDELSLYLLIPEVITFGGDFIKEFGRSVIHALIWVPYMSVSRRVKNTFVN